MSIAASNTIVRSIVPKTTAATLRRFATLTGKSQSAVISEFLTEVEPQIRRLCGMLEVAKKQQSMFPASTVAELEAALDELSGDATEVMDRLQRAVQLPLEKARRKAPASDAASVASSRRRQKRR